MWRRLFEEAPVDGAGGSGGNESQAPTAAEIETQARDIGWQGKDEFKGDPAKWVEASEYIKRGETFIPFLNGERRRLKGELSSRDQRLTAAEQELAATKTQLKELTEFRADMAKERKERRKTELGIELKAAREAGDDVKVAELQNELGEVVKPEVVKPPVQQQPQTPAIQPWVKSFVETNESFFRDPDRVALFNNEMSRRRNGGDARVGEVDGTALLNEAREAVEKKLGGNSRRQAPSKTEGSRSPGNSGNGSGGKSYTDLPAEAQEKCDADESRFVGEKGKAYKTQAEWRKAYAADYFGS